MWNQCLPCSLELIADDELTGPSKQASERATSERPEDARTHASHASSGSKDTRMPTLQPLPTLLLPPSSPATSPSPAAAALEQVHHSVSHKCCVIFAFSLQLPGALSSNLHSKNTRDDIQPGNAAPSSSSAARSPPSFAPFRVLSSLLCYRLLFVVCCSPIANP